jgi:cation:H+ antiporter
MTLFELALGLALLLGGGEALIRGAVAIAMRLGVSPLLIGLTLVGFGTSTPELVASVNAAWIGAPGIAVGNVVGSNIANVLLILGVAALIFPVAVSKAAFRRDGAVLIGASIVLTIIILTGALSRWAGLALLALLAAYTVYAYLTEARTAQERGTDNAAVANPGVPLAVAILFALGGIAGVIIGASLLVDSAIVIARSAGVSETVIGLTLVAVGTSLPELATSVMAALRRQGDLAFGNIVGSNIYNILGILGATGVIIPIAIPAEIAGFDVWVMLAAAVALAVFAITDWRITRREGAAFLLGYAVYLGLLISPGFRAALGIS